MDIGTRAKNIILSPNTEWPVIAAEQTTVGQLYSGYICTLAAIPPLCSMFGLLLMVGGGAFGAFAMGAVISYLINLAGVYVVSLIAQFLAPQFGGRADIVAALKLVGYAYTPAWLGGVFGLIPALGIITLLLAIYGFYLLYTGATPVVNVPQEKAVTFTVVLVIAVIVVFLITTALFRAILGAALIS